VKRTALLDRVRQCTSRILGFLGAHKILVGSVLGFFVLIIGSAAYLLATSPYSSDTIVQQPFTTAYVDNKVVITRHYTPHYYSGWLASTIGYYKQAVSIVWDRMTSPKMPAGNTQSIIANIHAMRFDPSKPYVISGDQFDDLYIRNLAVFYQDLLDPHTALSMTDWHNRQRIALQSLAYGMVAMQQLKRPVTTLSPISSHGVLAINIYDYPSDSMFGMLDTLQRLEADPATKQAAQMLQQQYHGGMLAAYQNYLATVRDPRTGLVRSSIHLSGARDAAQRQSSFYDNVVLWRTEQLATQLGFDHVTDQALSQLHQRMLSRYWDNAQGHFIDDVSPGNQHSYSSDWLIALPTGFLNPQHADDLAKLRRISSYIDQQHLASPLPIRYTTSSQMHENIFVKLFAGSYGNTAIWSYWGNLYITMQIDLYQQTHQPIYAQHAQTAIAGWKATITRDQGWPETLNSHGKLLENLFYESIRRNGWVINLEENEYQLSQTK
jgi:hypothetical protein